MEATGSNPVEPTGDFMKSTHAGNIPNMKGKKVISFSCGCCGAENLKEEERKKEAKKEIEQAIEELELEN